VWDKIKEIYASGFLFLAVAWILSHLILILLHKKVTIMESNKYILWTEITLTAGLLGFAIERIISAFGGL